MVNFYCEDGGYFTSSQKGGGVSIIVWGYLWPILYSATRGKYLVGDLLFSDTCLSSYYSHIYILFKMLDAH